MIERDEQNYIFERAVFELICDQGKSRANMDERIVAAKALQLQLIMNQKQPKYKHLELKMTDGRLTAFKKQ